MNLNKVVLIGRIASDINMVESRTGLSFVRFSLAISRDSFTSDRDEITDFIPVVAFRNNATFIDKFFNKGDLINVVGSMQSSQYTTRSGDVVNSITVVVDQIKSLEPRSITQARAERKNTTIAQQPIENKEAASFFPEDENKNSSSNPEEKPKNDNPWELDF